MIRTFPSAEERVVAISELAYCFWEGRGRPEGSSEEDWYKAELLIDLEQAGEAGNKKPSDTPPGNTRQKTKP